MCAEKQRKYYQLCFRLSEWSSITCFSSFTVEKNYHLSTYTSNKVSSSSSASFSDTIPGWCPQFMPLIKPIFTIISHHLPLWNVWFFCFKCTAKNVEVWCWFCIWKTRSKIWMNHYPLCKFEIYKKKYIFRDNCCLHLQNAIMLWWLWWSHTQSCIYRTTRVMRTLLHCCVLVKRPWWPFKYHPSFHIDLEIIILCV